jgi:hypothetical protein
MKLSRLEWLLLRVLPRLGSGVISFLGWSMRLEYRGLDRLASLKNQHKNIVFAFWHGRQLMMPFLYQKIHQQEKLAILISQHRDGEYISRIIQRFGIDSIRGSTYRGALKGLKQMIRALKSGVSVGITPDGPRGPKYKAQLGVIELAKLSGAPILPLSFGASKKKLSPVGTV